MMKPMSLATENTAANPALRSGYQAIQDNEAAGLGELPDLNAVLKKLDATMAIISMFEPKAITSHGMTWTKSNVFRVARLAVREVIPIHMPNQQRAMRLPAVATAAASAARTVVTSHSSLLPVGKAKGGAPTTFV